MYLLDTSVILELLLDQEKADDVERLFRKTKQDVSLFAESKVFLDCFFKRYLNQEKPRRTHES